MSLQMRLNIALGALTAMVVCALAGAVVLDGPTRTRAENASMMRLTESVITSSLPTLLKSPDPLVALDHLVQQLASLRHVSVRLERKAAGEPSIAPANQTSWLLADTQPKVTRIAVNMDGVWLATVVLSSRPDDELDEVWQSADKIIAYGALLVLGMSLLNSLVIRWSLSPINGFNEAIARMELGEFAAVSPHSGTPELRSIGTSLNKLAHALRKAKQENEALTLHIVRIQEEERKSLARDLHDEIGANLFALRSKAAVLLKKLSTEPLARERAEAIAKDVVDEIERLQQTNRRILQSLTPPALVELGLPGALEALAAMWRKHQPEVYLSCTVKGDTARLDDTLNITAYRIVQEALTNAYRHGAPSTIEATLDVAQDGQNSPTAVTIRIHDNGRGLPAGLREGFGLANMRNRVRALSGTFDVTSPPSCGTSITVCLPLPSRSTATNSCEN